MDIVVLGSAAGGGLPQWNCSCLLCRRARAGDPLVVSRTQSSLAVSADGQRWVLLNASPDVREQITRTGQLHPRGGGRDSPIAAVVLTNADVDHIAGLLSLREAQPFALMATRRVHEVLAANPVFNVLNPRLVARRTVGLDEAAAIAGADGEPTGLTVRLFPVPGKVALYLEDPAAGPELGTVAEDTVGVEMSGPQDGARFFYIPGCSRITGDLARRLDGAALVLFDGTVWSDDEMAATGVGAKTGQRMGHLCMSGPDGSIAAFSGLNVGRKLFIHINNTNPVLAGDSPERRTAEAAGWEIAVDGLEIRL